MTLPRDRLVALAREHVRAEAAGDLEATLATLDDVPRFELPTLRCRLEGRAAVRRYYEWLLGGFRERQRGGELRGEYVGEAGVVLEHVLRVAADDGRVSAHGVVTVFLGGGRALAGERVYAEPAFLALMVGPALADAVPLGDDGTSRSL